MYRATLNLAKLEFESAGGGPLTGDSEHVLLDEIRQIYKGKVVCGHDLDVF